MERTRSQQLEIERLCRALDATADPEDLRQVAKQLLRAWHSQKAATHWCIRHQLQARLFRGDPLSATPWRWAIQEHHAWHRQREQGWTRALLNPARCRRLTELASAAGGTQRPGAGLSRRS